MRMEKDNKKKSRRRFLAGLVGIAGFIGTGYYLTSKENEANIELFKFPVEIPGAREIRKYKTNGAKHCLVHILQAHYVRSKIDYDESYVTNVQRDIYNILSYLVDKKNIRNVYAEGFIPEDLLNFRASLEDFLRQYNELNSLERIYGAKLANDNEFQSKIGEARRAYSLVLEEIERKLGAVGRLVFEDKIIPKAGETFEANEAAIKDKRKGIISERVLDDREDVLLDVINCNKETLSVAVYGGLHAFGGEKSFGKDYNLNDRLSFKDNIYEWNLKNRDNKFSLIEVVPDHYKL